MFKNRDNKGESQSWCHQILPTPPPILLAQEVSGKIEFEYFFLSEEAGQTVFKLGWVGRHPVSV